MPGIRNILIAAFMVLALPAQSQAGAKTKKAPEAIRGKIKAIDGETVILDCGKKNGVRLRMEFSVFSKAKFVNLPFTEREIFIQEEKIAKLLVTAVKDEICHARVLKEESSGAELRAGMKVASVPRELEIRPNAPPDVTLIVEGKDIFSGAVVPVRVDISDLDDKSHFFRWKCSGGYFRMNETVKPQNVWYPPAAAGKYELSVVATDPKRATGSDKATVESPGQLRAPRIQMGPAGTFGFENRRFGMAGDLVFAEDGSLMLLDTFNRCLASLSADFRVRRVGIPFGSDQNLSRIAITESSISAIDPEACAGGIFERKSSFDLTASKFSFGGSGKVNGKFLEPVEVVITKTGETVVLDREGKRLQVFTPEGRFALSLGEEGEENSRLEDPIGMCLDSMDALYVLDAGNRKIQRYVDFRLEREFPLKEAEIAEPRAIAYNPRTRTLVLLDSADATVKSYSLGGEIQGFVFNQTGNKLGIPEDPTQIHCDVFGNIYVTAQEDCALLKYAWNGAFLGKWGGEETNRATRIAAGPDGEVFMLAPATGWMFSDETRNCVWKFDQSGWMVWRLGVPDKEAAFTEAIDIACGPKGNLFVLDAGAKAVLKFTPGGNPAGSIGTGEFTEPIDIEAGAEHIAVLEYKTRESVHLFDYNGNPIIKFPSQQAEVETYRPHRLACGAGGTVYVYSRYDHKILAFNKNGTVAAKWENQYNTILDDLAATPAGLLFLPEESGIVVIPHKRPELKRLAFEGLISRPLDIAADPLGRLYVLDEEPRRVIMFRFWK
ncbi:MAG: hypothetical protein ACYS8W_20445 [Planctomycetota bacterium]|jgi:hypothetical protein